MCSQHRQSSRVSLDAKEIKDLKVLALFTSVFCRKHHPNEEKAPIDDPQIPPSLRISKYRFCSECREFVTYAMVRRIKCPLDPKPSCKHCHIHCYRPGHREKVKEIMRFSGKYLMMRGRLDLLWHYFF